VKTGKKGRQVAVHHYNLSPFSLATTPGSLTHRDIPDGSLKKAGKATEKYNHIKEDIP
jgi:hypothetical protein